MAKKLSEDKNKEWRRIKANKIEEISRKVDGNIHTIEGLNENELGGLYNLFLKGLGRKLDEEFATCAEKEEAIQKGINKSLADFADMTRNSNKSMLVEKFVSLSGMSREKVEAMTASTIEELLKTLYQQ